MRGRTNAIDVGVSVIGEIIQCQVAESSRIEKGEFVETFYRGKTGYLPTPAHGWTNTDYAMKTNNFTTKVPGNNNLFIYRAREALKGTSVTLKLYNFKESELAELYSYDYGFVNNSYNTDLFFLNENYFFMFGFSNSESKDYLSLFKLNDQKTSFSLVQNFKPDFGDKVGYGRGRVFVRGNGIIYFNSYDPSNLYLFNFNGSKFVETPKLIPVTYTTVQEYGTTQPFGSSDIAKLSDNVYAYTGYYKASAGSGSYYQYFQVTVLRVASNGLSATAGPIYGDSSYQGSSSGSSSSVQSTFNVARLTNEFFLVNGGGAVSLTNKDIVRVFHITDGLVHTQDVNMSNSSYPLENLLEVKEGVVFAFSGRSVLNLIFEPTTRTLLWEWNNSNSFWEPSTVKRSVCVFSDNILFIIALYQLSSSEDNQGAYTFYTLKNKSLSIGFDGSDNLPNLVRSYSGGKISGIANQSGNEGNIISVNIPKTS